jgi:hypothetical protein
MKNRAREWCGICSPVQGFGPGLFIDDDRQHLRREERPIVDRDDVDLVRQVLAGQGQPVLERLFQRFRGLRNR